LIVYDPFWLDISEIRYLTHYLWKRKMAITRAHEVLQTCNSHQNVQKHPLHILELYPGHGSGQIGVKNRFLVFKKSLNIANKVRYLIRSDRIYIYIYIAKWFKEHKKTRDGLGTGRWPGWARDEPATENWNFKIWKLFLNV